MGICKVDDITEFYQKSWHFPRQLLTALQQQDGKKQVTGRGLGVPLL